MIKELFCNHEYRMEKWDERVAHKDDSSRKCEFFFQCVKCWKRTNIESHVGFDLIKRR